MARGKDSSCERNTYMQNHMYCCILFISLLDVYKETREEEVQLVKKQVKTITSEEGRRKMIETSHEMLQTNEVPFEKRGVHLGEEYILSHLHLLFLHFKHLLLLSLFIVNRETLWIGLSYGFLTNSLSIKLDPVGAFI